MNRWKSAALLALAAGLSTGVCGVAHAAPFTPLANTAQAFDLDTNPGSFSMWKATDLRNANAVRLTFAMNQVRADPKWAPFCAFALINGDETIRLRFLAPPNGGLMIGYVTRLKAGRTVSEDMLLSPIKVGEPVDLEIDWTAAGAVTFQVKSPEALSVSPTGEMHVGALPGAPTTLEIDGGTGELEVKSLQIGHTG